MKYVKMLGLAAVAAMALMAFLGASTASATVLCKTQLTEKCHELGWAYPNGTKFDGSLEGTAILESTGGTFEDTCLESTVKGEQETTGSDTETVKVAINSLSFGICSAPTKVLSPIGTMEIHWISGTDNGTVTATGFEVTVEAFGGVSCVYSAGAAPGTHLGIATGGSMGTIDIEAVVNKKSGSFLCPSDSIWKAKYTITEPAGAMYVATS